MTEPGDPKLAAMDAARIGCSRNRKISNWQRRLLCDSDALITEGFSIGSEGCSANRMLYFRQNLKKRTDAKKQCVLHSTRPCHVLQCSSKHTKTIRNAPKRLMPGERVTNYLERAKTQKHRSQTDCRSVSFEDSKERLELEFFVVLTRP